MTKLKGILLTQGMHGMISQVEGLAKALDLDFTHHKVELNDIRLATLDLQPVTFFVIFSEPFWGVKGLTRHIV